MSQRVFLSSAALLIFFSAAFADDKPPAAELKSITDQLEPLFKNLSTKPTITFASDGKTVVMRYLPQTFQVHGRGKAGEFAAEAHTEVGPSYKGFVLWIHLQPKGEVNQPVTPQRLQEPYWTTDLDLTPLKNADKQIFWGLSQGSRTSSTLLKEIREKLQSLGAPAK
jgi:hypothetical protein